MAAGGYARTECALFNLPHVDEMWRRATAQQDASTRLSSATMTISLRASSSHYISRSSGLGSCMTAKLDVFHEAYVLALHPYVYLRDIRLSTPKDGVTSVA